MVDGHSIGPGRRADRARGNPGTRSANCGCRPAPPPSTSPTQTARRIVSTAVWMPAYVALGSNLDDPPRQIAAAFERLATADGCRLIARSRLYRTAPLAPQDQPAFVNAAAGLPT